MKKPSKKEIISGIQFTITLTMVALGFLAFYLWILFAMCRLPIEWWSVLVVSALGLFSAGGLFQWIYISGGGE